MNGSKKDFLSIAKKINNYIKQENISVVHSHLSNADLIAVLIKIIYNKKLFVISSKHGYDEKYLVKYSPEVNPHIIDRNVYYYFTKFLLKNIDVNLSISRAISDLYFNIKLAPAPYHYIHHGISKTSTVDSGIMVVPNQLIIIGRLEKMKGHTFLLNAMPEIISQFPDIKLLILGEGAEKSNLEKQAKELEISNAITFMGFKPNPDLYIQQSEVIVLPSLFEPFGLVYIEAFSLKVPVVAFNVPASNEIIVDNETGLLAHKFDSKMLAQKIIYLLQNPDEKKRITENAYQKFLNYYTSERMVTATADWYKSVVPHTASRSLYFL
jgi:glycosyltransferase involved in cell wall biosynthesis